MESIGELRWQHRLFLVAGATEATVAELEARRAGIDERHVLWFCLVDGEVRTNFPGSLGDGFPAHLNGDYFARYGFPVLLIGKDGGVKSRDAQLSIDDYFIQIDAMPMRRAEMYGPGAD